MKISGPRLEEELAGLLSGKAEAVPAATKRKREVSHIVGLETRRGPAAMAITSNLAHLPSVEAFIKEEVREGGGASIKKKPDTLHIHGGSPQRNARRAAACRGVWGGCHKIHTQCPHTFAGRWWRGKGEEGGGVRWARGGGLCSHSPTRRG